MKQSLLLACLALAAGVRAGSAVASQFAPPRWLLTAEHRLLKRSFEDAKPIRVHYIPYPEKIAVIFEFERVVVCGLCGGPTDRSIPRGRVVRVSFDRRTHALGGARDGWAMRFCESVGSRPPKNSCLRR